MAEQEAKRYLGAVDLGFTSPDAILPAIVIWLIAKLFGA